MHSRPDAPSTFPLSRIKSIPDIHTHSRPDAIQPSLFCIKSIPNGVVGSSDVLPDVLDRVVHVSGCARTMSTLTKLLSSLLPLTPLLHVPPSKNDNVLIVSSPLCISGFYPRESS